MKEINAKVYFHDSQTTTNNFLILFIYFFWGGGSWLFGGLECIARLKRHQQILKYTKFNNKVVFAIVCKARNGTFMSIWEESKDWKPFNYSIGGIKDMH